MKLRILTAAILATIALAPHTAQATTSTKPVTVRSLSRLYTNDIAATITLDGPATITLTNVAYRHPEQVQATIVATEVGVFEIRDHCQPYLLPHTWKVYVDGTLVASTAGLRCR